MRHFMILLVGVILSVGIGVVAAQEDVCSTFVQDALDAVQDDCSAIGRNQACYGNNTLEAVAREGVEAFTFETRGDLANVADIDTLRLNAFDVTEDVWGIALLKIQANLPDALPGQNVTFLLFGDVEIQNAVEPGVDLASIEVTSTGNINVRSGPSTNDTVLGSLNSGEAITANGRIEDSSWLRIQLPDSSSLGWVFAELVTTDADVSDLSVVEADDVQIPLNPMQAFYFSTGVTGTDCAEAPESGILIQTPEGAGEITLRANDVDVRLGSSAYLQASDVMTVSVIEGQGEVTADGETVTIPAGAQVQIPIDENLQAEGPPSEPQPYDAASLENLPISVLPETIAIAPPLSEEDLMAQSGSGGGGSFDLGAAMSGGMTGMAGLDAATFCPYFNQAISEMGMTAADYLALIQQTVAYVPAEAQADYQAFIAILQQC